jgi:hypothetical protein
MCQQIKYLDYFYVITRLKVHINNVSNKLSVYQSDELRLIYLRIGL